MSNISIKPIGFQKQVLNDFLNTDKNIVLNCAIGTGKSWLVSIMAFYSAISKPNQNIAIITPTFKMGFDLYFAVGGSFTLRQFCLDNLPNNEVISNEQKMSLNFKNGSKIQILTGSDAAKLRGLTLTHCFIDEGAVIPKFKDLIAECKNRLRPVIGTNNKPGKLVACSTPVGMNDWYDLFVEAKSNKDFIVYNVDGYQAAVRDNSYYKKLQSSPSYESDVLVKFVASSGRVFADYNEEEHLIQKQYRDDLPLYIGIDYNVSPITAICFQKYGNSIYAIKEFEIFDSNTQELVDILEENFKYHKKEIIVCGDATWNRRKTSSQTTDEKIIKNKINSITGKNFITYDLVSTTNITDNEGFKFANKCLRDNQLFIDVSLKRVLKTINSCKWIDGSNYTKIKDDQHFADILKYSCHQILKNEANDGEIINIF